MRQVAVVTDSAACLPPSTLAEYEIELVPIWVVFGGAAYRDGIDITPTEVYARLRAGEHATTSSPAPEDFLHAYRAARRRAPSVFVVTYSRRLGMAFHSALEARRSMPHEAIEVLDSGTAAMAEGFVVLSAARAAANGASLQEVLLLAAQERQRVGLLGVLDTLHYLRRSGRVPAIAALAGSLLKVYPVLGDRSDGTIGLVALARTKERALESMVQTLARRTAGRPFASLAIMHADAAEEAASLSAALHQRWESAELMTLEFTPAMGAHTGPGTLALAYRLQREPEPMAP